MDMEVDLFDTLPFGPTPPLLDTPSSIAASFGTISMQPTPFSSSSIAPPVPMPMPFCCPWLMRAKASHHQSVMWPIGCKKNKKNCGEISFFLCSFAILNYEMLKGEQEWDQIHIGLILISISFLLRIACIDELDSTVIVNEGTSTL